MVDNTKIRVSLFKNQKNPTRGSDILISPFAPLQQILKLASENMGFQAKKLFNQQGNPLFSFDSLRDGAAIYVSQGQRFQVKLSARKQQPQTINKYSIAILGAAMVGKSNITFRYVSNKFTKEYDPTIHETFEKTAQVDGQTSMVSILDTAGMEDFHPLLDEWIDDKHAHILVFSVDIGDSLRRLRFFHDKIQHRYHSGKRPTVVLVANKVDLANRLITYEEGKAYADEIGVKYHEVSAFMNEGIDQLFSDVVRDLRAKEAPSSSQQQRKWYKRFCNLL